MTAPAFQSMTSFSISNNRRIAEILAVILTAAGKCIFMDLLNWRFPFIVAAIFFWAAYVIYRSKTNPGIMKYWGFRTDNFNTVLRMVLPFGLFSVITLIGAGIYQNTINITWHIIPILVLYPAWGILQQFLLIALTVGNMHDMKDQKINKVGLILFAALLFGLLHFPFVWLIVGTFILALFYGFIYLSERNIYLLGICHGWLAGILNYTVLDRDPFVETFGKLLHLTN